MACSMLVVLALGGPPARSQDQGGSSGAEPASRESARLSGEPVRSFGEVIREQFPAWDANHDGWLESREIDALMPRREIQGDAAAALATIKLRERKESLASRRDFSATLPFLAASHRVEDLASLDPAQPGRRPFRYEDYYRRNRRVLATLVRRLYAGQGPNFQVMQQGEVGDCYFFSMTGYLAARAPARIVRMIRPMAAGEGEGEGEGERSKGFLVQFANGNAVRVPEPTAAEVLVNNSSSSLKDGLWLPVLEIAVAEIMSTRARTRAAGRTGEVTDAMASGGDPVLMIHLYSGHLAEEFLLRRERYAPYLIPDLRRSLSRVLARGMLAAVSMAADPPRGGARIPGLGYNHSYAILAYDPATDLVTLWNPWGHTFQPQGPDGVQNGFTTEHGLFRLRMTALYEQFSMVHLETFEPTPDAF